MTEPMQRSEWNPPARTFRRSHLYGLMGLCALGSLFVPALTQRLLYPYMTDSYTSDFLSDPAYPPAAFDASDLAIESTVGDTFALDSRMQPGAQVETRAWEVLAAGFSPVIDWHEVDVPVGSSHELLVDATAGFTFRVLARGAPGCDVDAVISEDVSDTDTSSDATLDFSVGSTGQVLISFPVYSPDRSTCTVGLGVFRN